VETTIDVAEQSRVSEVRRLAAELGRAQGLNDQDLGRLALVASELASNLVKYACGGTITLGTFSEGDAAGVQVMSADRGPGFQDFQASIRDGHSTGGSLGLGLGIVMRSSDLFDVFTAPGQGSVLLARVARERRLDKPLPGTLDIGARRAAMRGEVECGDAWASSRSGRWQRLCIVDGLGHGPLAASAAADALAVFREAREADAPSDILARCHQALRSTRGAVMAVASIDVQAGMLLFGGVGNISAAVYSSAGTHHLLSSEGIVGYQMRAVRDVRKPWSASDTLILSTDGLSARWSIQRYPGLLQRQAGVTAAVLFRDFARTNDDATVLVARNTR
jgi:anti-sigma regulatory factor (Ser/Thr protein kinase)